MSNLILALATVYSFFHCNPSYDKGGEYENRQITDAEVVFGGQMTHNLGYLLNNGSRGLRLTHLPLRLFLSVQIHIGELTFALGEFRFLQFDLA